MSSWMQGDFSMIMSGNYELMLVSVPLLLIAYFYANKFTIAGMGEDFSRSLGLNYRQIVNIGLIISALVTASVVLSVGVIPFLGLIIPRSEEHTSELQSRGQLVCRLLLEKK